MHPLRGFAARLCLCLCVLFAQGVAAVHAFEHLHAHDTPTLAASDAANAVCALCLATGGFGAVPGGEGPPCVASPAALAQASGGGRVPLGAVGGYHARAPPAS